MIILQKQLENSTFDYVCRSLFKADRLAFALHFAHVMHPECFQENVRPGNNSAFTKVDNAIRNNFSLFCTQIHRNGKRLLDNFWQTAAPPKEERSKCPLGSTKIVPWPFSCWGPHFPACTASLTWAMRSCGLSLAGAQNARIKYRKAWKQGWLHSRRSCLYNHYALIASTLRWVSSLATRLVNAKHFLSHRNRHYLASTYQLASWHV